MTRSFKVDISENQRKLLIEYYNNWNYDPSIDLRFRFVKVLGYGVNDKEARWLFMNRYCNKRRMTYDELRVGIISLLEENFIPIRIFHSACEWIAPNEIHLNPESMWIRSSGFIPLENDDSLTISILTALTVSEKLKGKKYFVYSGNKSIHVWWPAFNFEDYLNLPEVQLFGSAHKREKMERRARKLLYEQLQNQISYSIDFRNATDPRRIVPIINTVNCFTGRIVTSLTNEQLSDNNAQSIEIMTEMKDWH
ncbi:MAG: hypothetical protein GPJ54_13310 [Candidatus Heimdallarchaeota archaeon]|nr:hypothetical protein [Candidatus Heimdallarchaeota archaeon]